MSTLKHTHTTHHADVFNDILWAVTDTPEGAYITFAKISSPDDDPTQSTLDHHDGPIQPPDDEWRCLFGRDV